MALMLEFRVLSILKNKITYLFLIFIISHSTLIAQEEEKDWTEEEEKSPLFFGGVNIGAFFSNSNSAIIYTGASNITPYGIDYILNIPQYKSTFDTYFKYPYALAETPLSPTYSPALDIGLHAGVNLNKMSAIYIDINIAKLKYKQFFTMEINDPLSQSPEPTYEQLPVLGEEQRFNLNLGTQLSLYNDEKSNFYWAFFGNFNSTKLVRNYIVINNREYEILHTSPQQPNVKPGGIGYGAGTGLGFKYKLTSNFVVDLAYNLYYTKTKMNDDIQPFGIHHGLLLRVIWN